MPINVKGFALHFTARSGSTFLIYTLKRHPQIRARAEVFGADRLPGDLQQTDDNQIKFLRKLWRAYRLDDRFDDDVARGFKVQVAWRDGQLRNPRRYAKVVGQYDVAKLFLYRRNRVKQIISSLRARQVMSMAQETNAVAGAHVFDSGRQQKVRTLPKLVIRPEHLLHSLESLEKSYRTLDALKTALGGGIELDYEDAMRDRQRFFDAIFKAIGVPSIDVTETDETKKITSDSLGDVVENLAELREALSGTVYESQLTAL